MSICRLNALFGSICWRLALTTPSLSRINTFMLCWVWSCVVVVIFVFFFCFHFLNNFPFILSFWVKDQKLDGWLPDQMLLCVKIASFTLINDELGLTALFHRCHNHNAQGHFVLAALTKRHCFMLREGKQPGCQWLIFICFGPSFCTVKYPDES